MKNIEIELRAKISKEQYDSLNQFLKKNSEDLGADNKDTLFYILPDKLFKVVNEESKNRTKIVLKDNRIGNGNNFGEWEIFINPSDYEKAIDLFNHMNFPGKSMRAWQERHNYLYKEVEIAVKYSEYWEYHVEMEIVVDDMAKKEEAEKKIYKVAEELGIKLMTDEEIKEFTESVELKL